MKKKLMVLFILITATPPAFGGSNRVQDGTQLFRQHHYQEAVLVLHALLPKIEPSLQAAVQLRFGIASLANARCYDRMNDVALALQIEYLKRLINAGETGTASASLLARLNLGKAYIASGQPTMAIQPLQEFLGTPQISANDRQEAYIALGGAYHATGKANQAQKMWAKVTVKHPRTAVLLAAAYQLAGMNDQKVMALADKGAAELLAAKGPLPIQCSSALLAIYARHNMIDKGFKILFRTDLDAFAHEEAIDANKVIRFYDPALLQNLAVFFSQNAIAALQQAATSTEAKIALTAAFYKAEAYAFSKNMTAAASAVEQLLTASPPQAIYQRARFREAAFNQKSQAGAQPFNGFGDLLTKDNDVALLSDLISLCAQLQIDAPQAALDLAMAAWQQSQGRPPAILGMALGHYYRARKDHTKALQFLETARDKSRKNRIEVNPPVMLLDLAWAYYHNRQFSEALEIYFSISKQFPAVRQVQVALQGIYSMEQQSAGDAKIF